MREDAQPFELPTDVRQGRPCCVSPTTFPTSSLATRAAGWTAALGPVQLTGSLWISHWPEGLGPWVTFHLHFWEAPRCPGEPRGAQT